MKNLNYRVQALTQRPTLAQLCALGAQYDPFYMGEMPNGDCYVAYGQIADFKPQQGDLTTLTQWQQQLKQQFQQPEIEVVGAGGFQTTDQRASVWGPLTTGYFFVPQFLVHLTATQAIYQGPADQQAWFEQQLAQQVALPAQRLQAVQTHALAAQHWQQGVTATVARLQQHQQQKVVLARVLAVTAGQAWQPVQVWQTLRQQQPQTYHFLLRYQDRTFISATPERLVARQGDQVTTAAIAGTIRRGVTPEQDQTLGAQLLNDAKNRQEQAYVVQAITQALRQLGLTVHYDQQPQLLKNPQVQHLWTPITGNGVVTLGALLASLHPTPALGGLPKVAALQQIRQVEPQQRGLFGAPIGHFNLAGDGEFAVGIRSGLLQGQQAWLFAGAGIVVGSQAPQEFQETALKFQPMLQALKGDAK
ncbi:isochorismate synthase [Loigolactobacillus bifermentans]|uniref:isochorismate synthase n=1 Tax=Loigolactobacillus bifermentans DSM 20003 TaxID=1423726 RepID=A0A0R1GMY7_9LACO|nr:isochorismate synthase [Loigolactobacillus bifermentans]KRK35404.1 menaquinone-specific isochorismate synthase [Loigolactobacillus bifermentans DSM 20003]QGG60392.1 isochorismate synthase [Loigolactobacillus bifermentans]